MQIYFISIAKQRFPRKTHLADLFDGTIRLSACFCDRTEHFTVVVDDTIMFAINQSIAFQPWRGNQNFNNCALLDRLRQACGNFAGQDKAVSGDPYFLVACFQQVFQEQLLIKMEIADAELGDSLQELIIFMIFIFDVNIRDESEDGCKQRRSAGQCQLRHESVLSQRGYIYQDGTQHACS